MINETVLPNPFKVHGSHLDNVMVAIEHELDDALADTLFAIERELLDPETPLPKFLDAGFLARLEAEVSRASARHRPRGHRIVQRLRSQLLSR